MSSGIFENLCFCFTGIKFRKVLIKDIEEHGGMCFQNLGKRIDFVVTTQESFDEQTPKITKAQKKNIAIVYDDFIKNCIKRNRLLKHDAYIVRFQDESESPSSHSSSSSASSSPSSSSEESDQELLDLHNMRTSQIRQVLRKRGEDDSGSKMEVSKRLERVMQPPNRQISLGARTRSSDHTPFCVCGTAKKIADANFCFHCGRKFTDNSVDYSPDVKVPLDVSKPTQNCSLKRKPQTQKTSQKRKSTGRGSPKPKSGRRSSPKQTSTRKSSLKRKYTRKGSSKRKPTRKSSPKRNSTRTSSPKRDRSPKYYSPEAASQQGMGSVLPEEVLNSWMSNLVPKIPAFSPFSPGQPAPITRRFATHTGEPIDNNNPNGYMTRGRSTRGNASRRPRRKERKPKNKRYSDFLANLDLTDSENEESGGGEVQYSRMTTTRRKDGNFQYRPCDYERVKRKIMAIEIDPNDAFRYTLKRKKALSQSTTSDDDNTSSSQSTTRFASPPSSSQSNEDDITSQEQILIKELKFAPTLSPVFSYTPNANSSASNERHVSKGTKIKPEPPSKHKASQNDSTLSSEEPQMDISTADQKHILTNSSNVSSTLSPGGASSNIKYSPVKSAASTSAPAAAPAQEQNLTKSQNIKSEPPPDRKAPMKAESSPRASNADGHTSGQTHITTENLVKPEPPFGKNFPKSTDAGQNSSDL